MSSEQDTPNKNVEPPTPHDPPPRDLAEHVEESVAAVAAFREAHDSDTSALQRVIDRVTDALGRPIGVVILVLMIVAWIAGTLAVSGRGIDQPSFAWLEFVGTMLALLMSVLILVTQRHEDRLAEKRIQLTLELALLSDRKNAKIIALIEELRRDLPAVRNRIDSESEDMQEAADPTSVLDAIDKRTDKQSQ